MGGNAFKDRVRRVTAEEVHQTVEWLSKNWPSANKDVRFLPNRVLGSAGMQKTSGDIDLNIDESIYDFEETNRELVQLVGEENVIARPGFNQIFTAVPIGGDLNNGRVQVDFMFGNYAWQEFSYAGTADPSMSMTPTSKQSQFKGLFRTELIKALVAFNSDWVLEEDGEMVARVGPTFFHDRGLVWRYRYRPIRKDGTARVKALKEVSKEEFLKEFPTAMSRSRDVIIDPEECVRFLFNTGWAVASDCDTYEDLWQMIRHYYPNDTHGTISKIYLERLNSLKVEIPEAILDAHRPRGQKAA